MYRYDRGFRFNEDYNRGIKQAESFVLNYYIMLRHEVSRNDTRKVKPCMLKIKIQKCDKVWENLEKDGADVDVYVTSLNKADEIDRIYAYTIIRIWSVEN